MNRIVRTEKKKMNTYVKFGAKMLGSAIVGAIVGVLGMLFLLKNNGMKMILSGCAAFVDLIRAYMLPILIGIVIVTVIYGEVNIYKLRNILTQIQDAEDEEADRLDYESEKTGARGMIVNILSQTFSILVIAPGYSTGYIAESDGSNFLICCLVFMLCLIYNGYYQVRYVKMVQKAYPEKKGDVASGKFQQQWIESCDEAERELIYQGTYKTYMLMARILPYAMLIAMLTNLFFETGVFAVFMIAVIWIIQSVTYLRSVVSLKGKKIK